MIKKLSQFVVLLLLTACTTSITPTLDASSTSGVTSSPTSISTLENVDMTKIRYLALGDSYTIGEKVVPRNRWPYQLADLLRNKSIEADVTIIARTGWTVQELWEGIQADPPEGMYDMVSLLIGVNDQYRGYPVDGYREDFRFMLGKAIEYAGGDPKRVVVLSIPDWGVTPYAQGRDIQQIANEIDLFNAINGEETEKAGAHYVDITPISREAVDAPELIASDGLHPSGKMYAMWADKVLPIALEILSI